MKLFLITLTACVGIGAMAQKKPNINKAKAAYDKGDLVEAKVIIDQAAKYEKTMNKAKTWYYRGMIYATLDTANNEPNAMETSISSFNKALELDPNQNTISEFTASGIVNVDTRLQGYYAHYYNTALEKYQSEQYVVAADNFEKASYIMPSDTNAILNTAYAATLANEDERARTYYEKALNAGVKIKEIYLRLYNYAIQSEDNEEALNIIKKGKEAFPDDIDFQKYEINILIKLDRVDEAKGGIKDAIVKEPNNPDLHFSLGIIQEESGDILGARESYEKAVAIDPDHFNSNYNIGVMIYNETNKIIKQRNALSHREKQQYDVLTDKIDSQLKEALPYWEKLYELKNEDETVLETLAYFYKLLKMDDKEEKMKNELEAVRG